MSRKEQFIKLPREVLQSEAWRSLSINARRLIDYLMVEHMRQGGKHNGGLLAPYRQLEHFGFHPNLIAGTIEEALRVGLVECRRGTGRRASVYALTWLPFSDGTEPSNRWRHCDTDATDIIAGRKATKTRSALQSEGTKPRAAKTRSALQSEGINARKMLETPINTVVPTLCSGNALQSEGTKPVKPYQSEGTIVPSKVRAPSRRSYQGGAVGSVLDGRDEQPEARSCRWYVAGDHGFKICSKPAAPGSEYCAEHAARNEAEASLGDQR
jgi:hypothetical protein